VVVRARRVQQRADDSADGWWRNCGRILTEPGVDLSGGQQTKTALEFFSCNLKATADA
jgi:hypothetical protein